MKMAKRKKPMFLRTDYDQYSKLGFRRKKKLVYRRAKGGENKQRLKMKGHLRNVSIGFKNEKKIRGLVRGLIPVMINNVEDIKNLKKDETGIVAKMGNKKKLEIAEYAFKHGIRLNNLNAGRFIQKIEEAKNMKHEEKSKKEKSRKEREKKVAEKEKEPKEEKKEEKEEKPSSDSKDKISSETKVSGGAAENSKIAAEAENNKNLEEKK